MAKSSKAVSKANENAAAGGVEFRWSWEVGRLLALIALSTVLWCFAFNRWTAETWQVPVEYGLKGPDGDTPGLLSHIKAAADGHFWPALSKQIPQLGAPFAGNWDDVPLVEQTIYSATGMLARLIGLFPAVNAAVMFAQILAAIGFYLVCRALHCDWRWAFAGALIFAFSQYPFARQLHHLQVLYFFHVPACLLVTWWLSSPEGIRFGDRRFWISAGIAALTGILHPYYTNMLVQLIGFACLVRFFRGDRKSVLVGAFLVAIAMATFLLMCANVFVYRWEHGANAGALVRAFHWLEFSALKPLDMLMPPPDHRFPAFAEFSQKYFKGVYVPGEVPPSSYLGILGIGAFVWLMIFSARRLFEQPPKLPPVEAWQVLWIGFYSVVGGFNCLVGAFGIQLFRSSNRYSIFILAIVLIFAVRRLSLLKWPSVRCYAVAVGAIFVGLWDQMPPRPYLEDIRALGETVEADRAFVAAMEERLPPGGMVYQIPIMRFPEEPAPGVPAYDHFRPYLHSKNLRYSFGSIKGRPEADWQQELARMDLRMVLTTLESYGFSALYINRNGFADKAEGILNALREMGRAEVIEHSQKDRVVVVLKPSSHPVKPYVGEFRSR